MPENTRNVQIGEASNSPPAGLCNVLESVAAKQDDIEGELPGGLIDVLAKPQIIAEKPEVGFQPIEAIVAFVDVLGTSALMESITQENATEITNKINGIRDIFSNKFIDFQKQMPESNLMIISDSYVISVPKEPDAFSKLITMLAECQHDCLVKHSEILRGAISAGAIIGGKIEKNVIIGPAFIKAHKLEMQNAIFPRIVIDSQIDKTLYPEGEDLPIASDKDGIQYIDFMKSSFADMENVKEKTKIGRSKVGTDTNKLQKWNWLLTFLEQKANGCLDCCKPNSTMKTFSS
jgi:hypothetical protein